jgi:archaellin
MSKTHDDIAIDSDDEYEVIHERVEMMEVEVSGVSLEQDESLKVGVTPVAGSSEKISETTSSTTKELSSTSESRSSIRFSLLTSAIPFEGEDVKEWLGYFG